MVGWIARRLRSRNLLGLGDWATIEELFWYRQANSTLCKRRYCVLSTERWEGGSEGEEGREKIVVMIKYMERAFGKGFCLWGRLFVSGLDGFG